MRSSGYFVIFIACLLIVTFGDYYFVSMIEGDSTRRALQTMMLLVLLVSGSAWLVSFLVHELEMWHYDYRIENGHLNITKGVFLKQKGSFPLSRITDIYLDRALLDFIFGLWNVHVSTATATSGEFARIYGLTERNALYLQRKLSELVQATSGMAIEARNVEREAVNDSRDRSRVDIVAIPDSDSENAPN